MIDAKWRNEGINLLSEKVSSPKLCFASSFKLLVSSLLAFEKIHCLFLKRSLSGQPRQRIISSLLQRPAGVAVSPWTGEIYVAATDSHRVYVIDKSGKIVKSLGSPYRSDSAGGPTHGNASHHSSHVSV